MALPCGFSVLHWHGVSLSRSRVLGCRVGFWAIFFSGRAGNVVQVEIFNDRLSFLIYLLLGNCCIYAGSCHLTAQNAANYAAGEELLHRRVYTQKFLRTEAFTQRSD